MLQLVDRQTDGRTLSQEQKKLLVPWTLDSRHAELTFFDAELDGFDGGALHWTFRYRHLC
jgi:hypothetical protein